MSGIRAVDVYRSTTTVRAVPVSRPTGEGGTIAGYMFAGSATIDEFDNTQIVDYDLSHPETPTFADYFVFDPFTGTANCVFTTWIYINAHARVYAPIASNVTLELHGFDNGTAALSDDLYDINAMPDTQPMYGGGNQYRTVHFSDMVKINETAAMYLSARYMNNGGGGSAVLDRCHMDIIVLPNMTIDGGA